MKNLLCGLAIGEIIGFVNKGKVRGSYRPITDIPVLKPGKWLPSISMAYDIGVVICDAKGYQPEAIMDAWAKNQSTFDAHIEGAIEYWKRFREPYTKEDRAGSGVVLARLAPVMAFPNSDKLAKSQAALTHGDPGAFICSDTLERTLRAIMSGASVSFPNPAVLREADVLSDARPQSVLSAAFWCVGRTTNFKDAVLKAANLGGRSDLIGAVVGQIAAAKYGVPNDWLTRIPSAQLALLTALGSRLIAVGGGSGGPSSGSSTRPIQEPRTMSKKLLADPAVAELVNKSVAKALAEERAVGKRAVKSAISDIKVLIKTLADDCKVAGNPGGGARIKDAGVQVVARLAEMVPS